MCGRTDQTHARLFTLSWLIDRKPAVALTFSATYRKEKPLLCVLSIQKKLDQSFANLLWVSRRLVIFQHPKTVAAQISPVQSKVTVKVMLTAIPND